MLTFSFIGYTMVELFWKPNNWQQIYKRTNSTLYTSNSVSKTCLEEKTLGRHNKVAKWLFNFVWKNAKAAIWDVLWKSCSLKNFVIFTGWMGKHLCWSIFLIQNIVKFLRAPILKNFCEQQLLEMFSWNWEKYKNIF